MILFTATDLLTEMPCFALAPAGDLQVGHVVGLTMPHDAGHLNLLCIVKHTVLGHNVAFQHADLCIAHGVSECVK